MENQHKIIALFNIDVIEYLIRKLESKEKNNNKNK